MTNRATESDLKLRQHAEEKINADVAGPGPVKQATAPESLTFEEVQPLLHELQVHQIELEMQNTEIRQARDVVETALEKYTDLYAFAPVGYFTFDRNGNIITVNLCGARLLGVERSRLIGRHF